MSIPVDAPGWAARPDWRWRTWRDQDAGPVPVIVGLIVLVLVFQALNGAFLSPDNLVNLTLQAAVTGVLTLGIVLVLMVGQIDLSVGAVSALAGATVAVGVVQQGWWLPLAVVIALGFGVAFGFAHGWMFTRLGVPSFVITLAGLLIGAGLQVQVLGATGSVNLPYESWLVRFAQQSFLHPLTAAVGVAVVVAVYLTSRLIERRNRLRADLPAGTIGSVLLRAGGLALMLGVPVWYLSRSRGVAAMVVLFLGLVFVADLLLRRTRWGRSVRAIGSNVESARRAGFAVRRVYLSAFIACAGLAAVAGVLSAGRLAAANQGTGGAEMALTAIAAAVIGGTSLFGGRGSAWSAVLGALVIHVIASGLTLLNADNSMRYIVTGLVLALAVTLDAVSRSNRTIPPR